jgi:hypothetical protein
VTALGERDDESTIGNVAAVARKPDAKKTADHRVRPRTPPVSLSRTDSGKQVFAPWADYRSYYLAPNGGLENGSTGWSLSGGASVTSGNQPFFASGSHSLSLPSGSRAVSPVTCIGPYALSLRMFGSDRGGSDRGLHVRVLWYGLLNQLLGASDYATFGGGSGWAPTSSVNSSGGFNLLLPFLGSTSARIEITPLGTDSSWRVDDVYVDPWASRN